MRVRAVILTCGLVSVSALSACGGGGAAQDTASSGGAAQGAGTFTCITPGDAASRDNVFLTRPDNPADAQGFLDYYAATWGCIVNDFDGKIGLADAIFTTQYQPVALDGMADVEQRVRGRGGDAYTAERHTVEAVEPLAGAGATDAFEIIAAVDFVEYDKDGDVHTSATTRRAYGVYQRPVPGDPDRMAWVVGSMEFLGSAGGSSVVTTIGPVEPPEPAGWSFEGSISSTTEQGWRYGIEWDFAIDVAEPDLGRTAPGHADVYAKAVGTVTITNQSDRPFELLEQPSFSIIFDGPAICHAGQFLGNVPGVSDGCLLHVLPVRRNDTHIVLEAGDSEQYQLEGGGAGHSTRIEGWTTEQADEVIEAINSQAPVLALAIGGVNIEGRKACGDFNPADHPIVVLCR